jgi:hypothetical protein
MRRRTFLWAACLVFAGNAAADNTSLTFPNSARSTAAVELSKPLGGRMKQAAEERLNAAIVNKQVKSRIVFPAYKDGVDLAPSGMWSLHDSKESIEDHGIGVEQGGMTTITAVKLRDKHIEFHLDGGGAGMFSEGFGPDPSEEKGKVPGGSRINLRFDRRITGGDLIDLGRLLALLEPVVDTAELRAHLAAAPLPPPDPPVAQATSPAPAAKSAPTAKPAPAIEPQPAAAASMAGMATPGLIDPQGPSTKPEPAKAAPAKPTPPPPAAAPTAAAKKDIASIKIPVGMDKRAVFALIGQPGYKRVDVSKEVPVEMWQYNLAGESKRIITFENGIVLKVEDF